MRAIGSTFEVSIRARLIEGLLALSDTASTRDEAAELAGEVAVIASSVQTPIALGIARRVAGEKARSEGSLRDAAARFEEAIDWFRKSRNVPWLARTLPELADALRATGQPERAEQIDREAAELLDRTRGPPK